MSEQIELHSTRNEVDKTFVGFSPNGGSIKPVHIAGGAQRVIYGKIYKSNHIKRMALVMSQKGFTPKGNSTEEIHDFLKEIEAIEDSESITDTDLEALRNTMQKLLSADKGVFIDKSLSDNMVTFTAGSKYFITGKSMYEDIGEFIGLVLCKYCSDLTNYINNLLENGNDPITHLFAPVLEDGNTVIYNSNIKPIEEIPAFSDKSDSMKEFINGLKASSSCLMKNLKNHPNSLTQLRIFNLYCIIQLIRYMSMLEAFYCGSTPNPILLDFSGSTPSRSSIARASEMSYTQMNKSINRFYTFAYAKLLNQRYTKEELIDSQTPVYEKPKDKKNSKPPKNTVEELTALWDMAKEQASQQTNSEEIFSIFGETIYDMLALESTSNPVVCLRVLGTGAGFLYPPNQPNKRFVPSQDIIETILKSCVEPDESVSSTEIRERLWNRFNIIIGGSSFETEKLKASNAIMQIDEDALEDNFTAFEQLLEAMDFAEIMADGILQIRFGGVSE